MVEKNKTKQNKKMVYFNQMVLILEKFALPAQPLPWPLGIKKNLIHSGFYPDKLVITMGKFNFFSYGLYFSYFSNISNEKNSWFTIYPKMKAWLATLFPEVLWPLPPLDNQLLHQWENIKWMQRKEHYLFVSQDRAYSLKSPLESLVFKPVLKIAV